MYYSSRVQILEEIIISDLIIPKGIRAEFELKIRFLSPETYPRVNFNEEEKKKPKILVTNNPAFLKKRRKKWNLIGKIQQTERKQKKKLTKSKQ